jgi:hypothetical protein
MEQLAAIPPIQERNAPVLSSPRTLRDISNIAAHRQSMLKRKVSSPDNANTDDEVGKIIIEEHKVTLLFYV